MVRFARSTLLWVGLTALVCSGVCRAEVDEDGCRELAERVTGCSLAGSEPICADPPLADSVLTWRSPGSGVDATVNGTRGFVSAYTDVALLAGLAAEATDDPTEPGAIAAVGAMADRVRSGDLCARCPWCSGS